MYAQCGGVQSVEICDMETVDFDMNSIPDGIINLYDEIGLTAEPGDVWTSTGSESATAVLNATTGEVRLWSLNNASSQYEFTLSSTSCAPDPRVTVDFTLGPYAGKATTTGFFSVCDLNDDCNGDIEIDIDLFETLEIREQEAPPHLNGTWTYTGSLSASDYRLEGSNFGGTVPYTPSDGSPVDSQDYTFTYTVDQQGLCVSESVDVSITLVRPPFAGYASNYNICATSIDTSWDRVINLNDDEYLNQENLDGSWRYQIDDDNFISISNQINLKEYVDDFLNSSEYMPGFGCHSFDFTYRVESRSAICFDDNATVSFTIFEDLKEFQQLNPPEEICTASDTRTSLDLYSLLEFQPGFEYQNPDDENEIVFWSFESGPAGAGDLGLNLFLNNTEISQRHRGTISLQNVTPGRYEYRYSVVSDTLCSGYRDQTLYGSNFCVPQISKGNPCGSISAPVIIDILDFDYAGEDTTLNFCITDTTGDVSLVSLLQDNGNTIDAGIWTETDTGVVVNDMFSFPDSVDDPLSFSFTYTSDNGTTCIDTAILQFTIYPEANAGNGADVSVCSDDLTITLFDLLIDNPDPTGVWFGPFGYTSPDHLGVFDMNDVTLPILGPGEYVYVVASNAGCPESDRTSVFISIEDPVEIGQDVNETFCIQDGSINLYSLLDRETVRTGMFQDTENTGALTTEGLVDFTLLPNPDNLVNPIYNFRYVVSNNIPCDESSLNVAIQIIDLPEPNVPDQEFCILDAKHLDDIEVDVLNYNWYTSLESDMPVIDNPILLDNQVFYITNVDADNCESDRVAVAINILNMGERFSNGELCTLDFQDGVSPDGNNQNDVFELVKEELGEAYNIPEAFPDFELKIFNRYGNTVYEGTINTEKFRGESNVSIRLGDDLPSGTYFYIFTPNFENNLPIQGSFYLSR
ncbi:hypothetical protein GCM10022393_18040 [Aquimarina addita]|uniref:Gliding motility-associated C-terminal domain-containing protein n=2 Tax=Aquimarina addita TaxID=870485 RepID=A0ABP6UKN8_9FLAO